VKIVIHKLCSQEDNQVLAIFLRNKKQKENGRKRQQHGKKDDSPAGN
jgi:hypothetical protein